MQRARNTRASNTAAAPARALLCGASAHVWCDFNLHQFNSTAAVTFSSFALPSLPFFLFATPRRVRLQDESWCPLNSAYVRFIYRNRTGTGTGTGAGAGPGYPVLVLVPVRYALWLLSYGQLSYVSSAQAAALSGVSVGGIDRGFSARAQILLRRIRRSLLWQPFSALIEPVPVAELGQ